MSLVNYQSNNSMPINVINGRVNTMTNQNRFEIFNEPQKKDCNFVNTAIGHSYASTPLSNIYFSSDNIEALQKGLRNMVLNKSNGKYAISRQSDIELKIIMRSFYLQYARNRTDIPIIEQVKTLNGFVLEWSVPEIISNLKQKEKYIKDINSLPIPLERAELTNQKGLKQLEMYKS